jgi:hypothetical protein
VVGKAWRLGLGAPPFNPRLQGSYDDTALFVFGGSVTWDF